MTLGNKHNQQDCSQVREALSEHLDGRLDPSREAMVRKHLEGCQTCREELASLRQTVSLLNKMPMTPAPHSFTLSQAQVGRTVRASWWRRQWVWQLSTAAALFCLALLMVGDYFQFIGPAPVSQAPTPSPAPTATLPPTPSGPSPKIQSIGPMATEAAPTVAAPDRSISAQPPVTAPQRSLSQWPWEIALGCVVAVLGTGAIIARRRARVMVGRRRY